MGMSRFKMAYFDLVDNQDNPLGKTASYDTVHRQGLWHRGVHAIIYTPDREIVMQKRSPNLKCHPGEIEVSVGGGVDAGETPRQAIVREIREEIGVEVDESELRYIGKTKYNHQTKTQITRVFNYSYAVCLPKERLAMTTNREEATDAFLLTKRKLRAALRRHRIKDFGKICGTYAYWRTLLAAV